MQQQPDYVGIGLDLFDSGMSMLAVCELVVQVMGPPTNETFVNTVYQNLVGMARSQAELDLYVGLLVGSGGPYTQAQLLELAADADANATNIGLVGLQQDAWKVTIGSCGAPMSRSGTSARTTGTRTAKSAGRRRTGFASG